jgi:hypothetical protein
MPTTIDLKNDLAKAGEALKALANDAITEGVIIAEQLCEKCGATLINHFKLNPGDDCPICARVRQHQQSPSALAPIAAEVGVTSYKGKVGEAGPSA